MSTFEFDSTYSAMTGEHVGGIYIPTVEADPDYDCLVDGHIDTEWHFVTGKTRQYGYHGAVMHPSETADDDTIREWVRDAGGDVFAIVPVEDSEQGYDDATGERWDVPPVGWAVIYRSA